MTKDASMLADMTVIEFCKVLGSDLPAPGGGSVAALSGALAANLVSMVCRLSIGRKDYAQYERTLADTLQKSGALAESLLERVDKDTEAFNGVMAAFKLPKATDEEKQLRSAEIQNAYKQAIQSPLSIAMECRDVLFFASNIVGKSNTNALSDLGVAAQQAFAGLEGAIMNVRINLPSIKDEDYKSEINERTDSLLNEGQRFQQAIYKHVTK